MNGERWLGIAAAGTVLLGGLWMAEAGSAKSPAPIAVAAKLTPCVDGSFALDAEIRDLVSGQTLLRPAVRFVDGGRASVKTEIPGREVYDLRVAADRERNTATIELARIDGRDSTPLSRFDVRLR